MSSSTPSAECLPVTEEERVRYNGLGPWDLDVTS